MTQDEALTILKTGKNVFLTGEPGSGKTHTVNRFVSWLREHGVEPAVTASTGIAATHIAGHTIHSWSGIGVRQELTKYDLNRITSNKRVINRVNSAHTLIIDEISMLSARTFALVETACRAIRGGSIPFGGLQVVLVGDFFQLPPIVAREEENTTEENIFGAGIAETQSLFAFNSPLWRALKLNVCYLSEQYRQDDKVFLEILSAIRSGTISAQHRDMLETRLTHQVADGATQFFPHNADVDRVNSAKLLKLSGEARVFDMESHGSKQIVDRLKRGCLSPETLTLKIGAKVMFTKNDISRHRFVNGTLGTVSEFSKENGGPIVKTNTRRTIIAEPMEWSIEDGGRVLARIAQIPLRLAWAITVHKSQGMSLDAAHMDLSDAFEYGQGYVAISRVRTLAGLSFSGWNDRALEVHPEIAAKDAEFRDASRAVQDDFANISVIELEKWQSDFIRLCGGNVESIKTTKRANGDFVTRNKKAPRWERTLELMREGKTIDEAASLQNKKSDTIINHIEELLALGKLSCSNISHLLKGKENIIAEIHDVFEKLGIERLKPIYDHFNGRFSYTTIRLAKLFFKNNDVT